MPGCRVLLRYVLPLVLGSQLSACSATSTFLPHPLRIEPYKAQLTSTPTAGFGNLLNSEVNSNDKILYAMERGRLAQLNGELDTSRKDYATAIAAIEEHERKATVSVSDLGANLAALAVNDNAIPYQGEGYERVLLHHYQALNYLLVGQLDGAAVEFRWANAEQDRSLKAHAADIESVENQSREAQVSAWLADNSIQQRYAQLDERVGQLKNSFQNAYSFYLSGLVYELRGEENDAYIDYKKALEIVPENPFVQQEVLRLARKLAMDEDLQQLSRRFPAAVQALADGSPRAGEGELVVLYEEDFLPPREELKIPLPLPDGLAVVAVPFYAAPWQAERALEVTWDEQLLGRTAVLSNIRSLAGKSLRERYPLILTRQLLRLMTKLATRRLAEERLGDLGKLVSDLYNFFSENADLRSWLTLPQNAQLLRVAVPAGVQQVTLQQTSSNNANVVSIDIPSGGIGLLYVARIGNRYYPATVSFPRR